MKKMALLILVICFSKICLAQDTIKVAVVGSSLVSYRGVDYVGSYDSLWHGKYVARLQATMGKPVKVYLISYGGGRTIGSIDPRKIFGRTWISTNYESDYGLVDSVLKVNPNIVIISAQTNEIANGMPIATVIGCFKSCIDTLKKRGIQYIITDGYPRQTFFPGGGNSTTYNDSTVKFNTWLYNNYNKNTARIYKKMYDSVVRNRPFPSVLAGDSLHPNLTGQVKLLEALLEAPITQGIISNFVPNASFLKLTKVGDSLELKCNYKGQIIKISGSNDYTTFTEVKKINIFSYNKEIIKESILDTGYLWYKVELYNSKILTLTKRIN